MKYFVFILPNLKEKINILQVKAAIRKYVGERMIADDSDESPCLVLNEKLTDKDKQEISKMYENCGFIFMNQECDDDDERLKENYIEVTI